MYFISEQNILNLMKSNLQQQVRSGKVMLMFLSSGFMLQVNIILETLLLQNFRLVSKRDAQLQSQLEENKVKDRESKREQKEKLKWYHNLFCLNCPFHVTSHFMQNYCTCSRIFQSCPCHAKMSCCHLQMKKYFSSR